MSMQDPVADMLTRVRNAIGARMSEVVMPSSKVKAAIAEVLKSEGYVADCKVLPGEPQPTLKIELKYTKGRSVLEGIQRVSRPSRRVYVGYDEIPKVMSGLGVNILSTNRGVMSDRLARQQKLGGEILCAVW